VVLTEYVLGQISKSSCLTSAEEQEIKKKLSNFVSRFTTNGKLAITTKHFLRNKYQK